MLEPYEDAAVTGPAFGHGLSLIQDQLEPEQADLKDERPPSFFVVPLQGETKLVGVEVERTTGVLDEEHAPCIEILHDRFPLSLLVEITDNATYSWSGRGHRLAGDARSADALVMALAVCQK